MICPQRTASPPVGAVLDGLGVDLTAAHVFGTERQPLSVPDLSLSHGLQVGLLHLRVASPHDLPTEIHGHGRLLPTQLKHGGGGEERVRYKRRGKKKGYGGMQGSGTAGVKEGLFSIPGQQIFLQLTQCNLLYNTLQLWVYYMTARSCY